MGDSERPQGVIGRLFAANKGTTANQKLSVIFPKLKNGALNDLYPLAHLGGRCIDAPEPVIFSAMFSCMFF
jgi:hypothetical protein